MLLPPINKNAVAPTDKWLVIVTEDPTGFNWRVVEGQPTRLAADHAKIVLQKHADANPLTCHGRKYDVRERLAYTP